MGLEDGKYTLRASPVVGVGGEYATGNGLEKIITVAAQVPPFFDRQIWNIHVVNTEKNIYNIFGQSNGSTFEGTWSPKDASDHEGPFILAEEVVELSITPADNGVPDAYIIRTITNIIGVDWVVGTENGEVFLKPYPIVPGIELPYWQIRPHGN